LYPNTSQDSNSNPIFAELYSTAITLKIRMKFAKGEENEIVIEVNKRERRGY
jgi:hypothetical protein